MHPWKAGVMAAVLLGSVTPAWALDRAQHTVEWYRTHQATRESVLQTCQNDHSYDDSADCRNATSAAHAALADRLAPSPSKDPEADPAYYGHDGGMIAMTLSFCSRHQAPPAWCTAAQTAKNNMK